MRQTCSSGEALGKAGLGLLLALAALTGGTGTLSAASAKPKSVVVPVKMPPLPPAVIDDSLAIGGEDIDARKTGTRMTVAVNVNDRGPYRFVVDSGADTSVIGLGVARALQLPLGMPVFLNGMTDSGTVDRVLVGALELGQTTFHDLQLPVLKEGDLGGEGMIGIDALVEQRLMMDFEKRVITVEDAKRPARRLDGEIVVTARRRHGQLILTQVTANGRTVDAVVDTGSEVTIGNMKLRDQLLRRHRGKLSTIEVIGVTGVPMELQMVRIAEIRLGTVILRDVPIAFAEVAPFAVFGLSDEPALLLGTDLMATFRRVSLDFRARKVRFQLRRCEPTGIVANTVQTASLMHLSVQGGDGEACRR